MFWSCIIYKNFDAKASAINFVERLGQVIKLFIKNSQHIKVRVSGGDICWLDITSSWACVRTCQQTVTVERFLT
jgi:hypothetical protein